MFITLSDTNYFIVLCRDAEASRDELKLNIQNLKDMQAKRLKKLNKNSKTYNRWIT